MTPYLNPIRIRGSSYISTLAPAWFSLLSLCPDGPRWLYVGWCGIMDSRELPRGGWISCTFVGHPEGLWVHHLPRVLDTWGHDHRPTPSLWSEGEDFSVPDQSCLGRVGVYGTRKELVRHGAEGCSWGTHNLLWEAPFRDSQLCRLSNSDTRATHCTGWWTRNYPSSPEQLSL
jgi:hypothetical protein